MIKLFDKDATSFNTLGLGILDDVTECSVDEELNGPFELDMTYPAQGKLADQIKIGNIIVCKPNPYSPPQPFVIDEVGKTLDMEIEVRAQHISYQLSYIPVLPFSANTAQDALVKLKQNAAEPFPFVFQTDITGQKDLIVSEPKTARSIMGDDEDAIIGVYGGEYLFDRYTVKLLKSRGENRGMSFRYGKDLTSLRQDQNISDVVTGIVPYWKGSIPFLRNTNALTTVRNNGYFSAASAQIISDSGRRCIRYPVNAGEEYYVSTIIRGSDMSGVIFYDSLGGVVSHYLVGVGKQEEIKDCWFLVPDGSASIAVNSAVASYPILVKDVTKSVSLTIKNGHYVSAYYGFLEDSSYKSAERSVQSGYKFRLNGKAQSPDIASVIFYDENQSVVNKIFLAEDTGEEKVIEDYDFEVPNDAVLMAVNSYSDAPTLQFVSNTVSDNVDTVITLSEKKLHGSSQAGYPYYRTVPQSFDFDNQPSESELRTAAQSYISDAKFGVPKINLKISAADLRKTSEYKDLDIIPEVLIGDTVSVVFDELGVEATAEVRRATYDVINDEYKSIEIGDVKDDIPRSIYKITMGEKAVKAIKKAYIVGGATIVV